MAKANQKSIRKKLPSDPKAEYLDYVIESLEKLERAWDVLHYVNITELWEKVYHVQSLLNATEWGQVENFLKTYEGYLGHLAPISGNDVKAILQLLKGKKKPLLSWQMQAVALRVTHTDMTVKEIANLVGKSERSVERIPEFQTARRQNKANKFERPRGYKTEDGELEAWREEKREQLVSPSIIQEPTSDIEKHEVQKEVMRLIGQLPETYRQVYELKHGEDRHSDKEIADILGVTQKDVRARRFEAEKLLKKKLEALNEQDE